jgi:DNA-binding transcriptional LysR family regulator
LASVGGSLEALNAAIASARDDEPSGVLRVSMSPVFGLDWILPLLPDFLRSHPKIRPDWHFENRQVDLIAEGFDAAIGGGLDLKPNIVSRTLAPAHLVAVASKSFLRGRTLPGQLNDLAKLDGIVMRSPRTGRLRQWRMGDARGREAPASLTERLVVNDPAALREAARLGLGVAILAVPDVLPDLEKGTLVRLVPSWYADGGSFQLYYASVALSAKARAFVELVVQAFRENHYARRFSARSI